MTRAAAVDGCISAEIGIFYFLEGHTSATAACVKRSSCESAFRFDHLAICQTYFAGSDGLARNEQFRVDVLKIPFERLALEVVSQLSTIGNVTKVTLKKQTTRLERFVNKDA